MRSDVLVPAVGMGIFCSAGGFFDSFEGSDIGLGGVMSLKDVSPYISPDKLHAILKLKERGESAVRIKRGW